jgi:LysR family transcriptional activator of nhaA
MRAEVDDMAMLRLLARDSGWLALLPEVVVQDELRGGVLCVVGRSDRCARTSTPSRRRTGSGRSCWTPCWSSR